MDSCIWFDVFTKDETDRIFTLDMQRAYFKKRVRNRMVYYGAKELAAQEVKDSAYEHLKQVSITFILEDNKTPRALPVSKIQLTNVETGEVYVDLLTLYEVNLNLIEATNTQEEDLVVLKAFLTIKTHNDLCGFVNAYDTNFAIRLVTEYIKAATEDKLLQKIEGSESMMNKATEWALEDAEIRGINKGQIKVAINIIKNLSIPLSQAIQVLELPESLRPKVIEALEEQNINYTL